MRAFGDRKWSRTAGGRKHKSLSQDTDVLSAASVRDHIRAQPTGAKEDGKRGCSLTSGWLLTQMWILRKPYRPWHWFSIPKPTPECIVTTSVKKKSKMENEVREMCKYFVYNNHLKCQRLSFTIYLYWYKLYKHTHNTHSILVKMLS